MTDIKDDLFGCLRTHRLVNAIVVYSILISDALPNLLLTFVSNDE